MAGKVTAVFKIMAPGAGAPRAPLGPCSAQV